MTRTSTSSAVRWGEWSLLRVSIRPSSLALWLSRHPTYLHCYYKDYFTCNIRERHYAAKRFIQKISSKNKHNKCGSQSPEFGDSSRTEDLLIIHQDRLVWVEIRNQQSAGHWADPWCRVSSRRPARDLRPTNTRTNGVNNLMTVSEPEILLELQHYSFRW